MVSWGLRQRLVELDCDGSHADTKPVVTTALPMAGRRKYTTRPAPFWWTAHFFEQS